MNSRADFMIQWVNGLRDKMFTVKSREELYNEACAFAINKFEYGDHAYGNGIHGEHIAGDRDYKFKELLEAERKKVKNLLQSQDLEELYKEYPNLKWQLEKAKTGLFYENESTITPIGGVDVDSLSGV